MSQVLRNSYSKEDSVAGTPTTVTLPWRSRQVIITNDHASNNLLVRFGAGSTVTLKPNESLSTLLWIDSVILDGTASYRLWAFG